MMFKINILKNMYIYFVSIIGLALVGCGSDNDTVNSDIVNTTNTHANIHITAGNTGKAYINIELKPDGPASTTNIKLSDGDTLWAYNYDPSDFSGDSGDLFSELSYVANNSTNVKEGGTFFYSFLGFRIQGDIWYSGFIPTSNNNTYYVSLLRDSFQDAVGSYVTLPDIFSITAPLSNETHSRSNDLQINWQTTDDNHSVNISIFTTCLNSINDTHDIIGLADTGSYVLPAADFTRRANGSCNTNVEIVKAQVGQLNPNFNSGIITGNRVDKTVFISTD